MVNTLRNLIANDNDPAWRNPSLEMIDYKTFVREQPGASKREFAAKAETVPALTVEAPTVDAPSAKAKVDVRTDTQPVELIKAVKSKNLAFGPWLVAMAVAVMAFIGWGSAVVKILAATAVTLTGLMTAKIASKANKAQLAEMANLSAVAGGVGALFGLNALMGSPISPSDGLGIVAVGSLILASVIRSPICLIASACASMLWAVLGFIGAVPHSLAFAAFPIIASIQLYYGAALKSRVAIMAATLSAYAWLIGFCFVFVNSGAITMLMASGVLFIAGVMQYRWGKAFEDEASYGSPIHTHFGWIVAILGALSAQHFWLFPDSAMWQNMQSTRLGSVGWQLATILAVAGIYLSGLVRWKHKHLTKTGAVMAAVIAGLLPLAIWAAPVLGITGNLIPGLYAAPTIGLIIAGAVLASCIGMALNGVRRNSTGMIVIGMLGIGAQAAFLLTPSLFTFENVMVFMLSLAASLCVGGIIAGRSLLKRADSPKPLLAKAA